MCLLSIAWQVHPDYPLVFVGNRDEYHARPSASADWWDDNPDILGGRDLEAGGSWLGVNKQGRLAVVTNRPDLPAPGTHARSRGELVNAWLSNDPGASAIDKLAQRASRYGGFSLMLAEPNKLTRVSGGHGLNGLETVKLEPGVSGLSNTAPDDPWPKLTWLNQQLEAHLTRGEPDPEALMEFLLRTEPVPSGPPTGVSGLPFVTDQEYGTRSSSVITLNSAGECRFLERRFGPGGRPGGRSDYCFRIER
jgi:uncharacterized protein with NRDE domain